MAARMDDVDSQTYFHRLSPDTITGDIKQKNVCGWLGLPSIAGKSELDLIIAKFRGERSSVPQGSAWPRELRAGSTLP
jgi:hypothetical protein